jgi:hypothetical protein
VSQELDAASFDFENRECLVALTEQSLARANVAETLVADTDAAQQPGQGETRTPRRLIVHCLSPWNGVAADLCRRRRF